ncbi:MAG: CDP-glycerol glycerophosphotransferase family protein [Kurthia sp.]|nr:CDP-glycerol glycerophosphotransferase family protein [Candidatus Kurthia equi]
MEIKWPILRVVKLAVTLSYKAMTLFSPVKEKKIVIFNYRQQELEGNLKLLVEEISHQVPEVSMYIDRTAKKISFKLLKNLWLMRNASKVIVDDYFLPGYMIKPRKETEIIQIWHATGAFKKFGLSTKNTLFGPSDKYLAIIPVHSHYNKVYVSTEVSSKFFAEAFGMEQSQLTVLGIPRVEPLIERKLQQPIPFTTQQEEMVKVLIAPTYRAKTPKSESELDWVNEITAILPQLPPTILLIVVLHPYEDASRWAPVLGDEQQLIIDTENSSNVWMAEADCFLTDYSSALFEFALFERPLANYVPDLQQYMENRGLYRPLQDITDGDILYERQQLVTWIKERQPNEYKHTKRMVEENIGQTKHITKNIVQHMFMSK